MPDTPLSLAFAAALQLEARRDYAAAAVRLDDALDGAGEKTGSLRFRALVLRADLAVSLNDLIAGRGILAEARQIRLTAEERAELAADQGRADDLEAFFTHRGCAG